MMEDKFDECIFVAKSLSIHFVLIICSPLLGAKTHKTSDQVRVVEKSGKSYTVKGDIGFSVISPECRRYMVLTDEVLIC